MVYTVRMSNFDEPVMLSDNVRPSMLTFQVNAILVNIFGGIMKCDTIAHGVITACKAVNLKVPLVVRMKGTNEDLGKQMLADSGLPIISADTMAEAAQAVVAALKA